jgi:hypothetical protein
VVVDEGIPEIKVGEHRDEDLVAFFFDVEEVGGDEVERSGVEVKESIKFLGGIPEVAKLGI